MLQIPPNQRLAYILQRIEALGMRFPVAEIAEKFPYNAGNVSAILAGKKSISENFWKKFIQHYGENVKVSGHTISMSAEEYIKRLERDKELLGESILVSLTGLQLGQNTLTAMISGGLQELAKVSARVLNQPLPEVANRISKANDAAASSLKKADKPSGNRGKG